jgi:hypothetical protein
VLFGLDQVGGREVARNPRARTAYIAGIVTLRGLLAVAVYAMLTLVVFSVPATGLPARVVLTQGLVLFARAGNLGWAFQGLEWMGGYALAVSLGQLVFAATALEFVEGPKDVGRAPLCYLAGEATATILLLIQFVRRFGVSAPLRDRALWLASLGEGAPFLMSRLVRTIGVTFDVFALKLYLGDTAVGLYGAAASPCSCWVLAVLYFVNISVGEGLASRRGPQSLFAESLRLSAICLVPIESEVRSSDRARDNAIRSHTWRGTASGLLLEALPWRSSARTTGSPHGHRPQLTRMGIVSARAVTLMNVPWSGWGLRGASPG